MKLLAAVDLNEDHKWMIKQTAAWAERMEATVDLLHVTPRSLLQAPEETPGHARKRLEGLMGFVPLILRGRCILRTGDPSDEILLQAAEGYGLLVVATHGRTGVSRMVMGSIAERIVRQADIPTLVLRLSLLD